METFLGKTSIFIFASNNCRACLELMPHLTKFHEKYGIKTNLTLFIHADIQSCIDLVNSYGLKTNVIADSDGAIANLYKVRATPFAYKIDSTGVICRRGIVNDTEGLEELLETMDKTSQLVDLPGS